MQRNHRSSKQWIPYSFHDDWVEFLRFCSQDWRGCSLNIDLARYIVPNILFNALTPYLCSSNFLYYIVTWRSATTLGVHMSVPADYLIFVLRHLHFNFSSTSPPLIHHCYLVLMRTFGSTLDACKMHAKYPFILFMPNLTFKHKCCVSPDTEAVHTTYDNILLCQCWLIMMPVLQIITQKYIPPQSPWIIIGMTYLMTCRTCITQCHHQNQWILILQFLFIIL